MPEPPISANSEALRRRIRELGPWYQNIQVAAGVWTKDLSGDADIFPGEDIPAPLWRLIRSDLPDDLSGHRVLDIGCNAGYMSFECKKLGADYVLGIDSNLGSAVSFVEQARFCRDALGLDVDFREQSMFDEVPEAPFHVVLFCGVLYHLENWADSLDRVRELVARESGRVVLETAIEPVTQTVYDGKKYRGDSLTFFVPSVRLLVVALEERGFRIQVLRDIGTRAIAVLSAT